MAVKARRRVRGVGRLQYQVTAAAILASDHPLNKPFVAWLKGAEPSKRKARAFLSLYPQFRGV